MTMFEKSFLVKKCDISDINAATCLMSTIQRMADTCQIRVEKGKCASLMKLVSGTNSFWFWYKLFLVLVAIVFGSGTSSFEFW